MRISHGFMRSPLGRLNQAVKRNAPRFPPDFAFQLSRADLAQLRAQLIASRGNISAIQRDSANRSQSVTGSQKHRSDHPWVFAEHGALMAANVIRSEAAVRMSVFVVRAFVRLREHAVANTVILKRLAEIDQTLLQLTARSATYTASCSHCFRRRLTRQSAGSGSSRSLQGGQNL
jgi:ORF6N domain-containing protein